MNAASGSRSNRLLSFSSAICIVVTVIAAGAAVWQLHDDRIAQTMHEADGLAVVLAAQTERSFQAVDLVMREVVDAISAAHIEDAAQLRQQMGTIETHQFLVDHLRSLPQADGLSLIDAQGLVVSLARSWPTPRIDTADRDYFIYWRDHPDGGFFIGTPIVNKVTGRWILTMTRRVSGSNGQFLGIVFVSLDIGYFQEFYRSAGAAEGEAITLFRTDGTIIARAPPIERLIGARLASESPWYSVLARGGGTYQTPGYVGGVPRIISVHRVPDAPLAITVGFEEHVALAPWRRQSAMVGLGALGAIIGFGVLFRALAAQLRRSRASEARFRDFATTSSDWFWETDASHRFSYMSENVQKLGTSPAQYLGRTRMDSAGDVDSEPEKWREHTRQLDHHEPFQNFVYRRKGSMTGADTASVSGIPIFDQKGRFIGYRGTARDVTEQIRAERNLRAAKEDAETASIAKSRFLANMSHELRTPLNAVIGFSEALQAGISGPLSAKALEYVGLIHKSGAHLLAVINDVLDLAKVEAGKFELNEESGIDPAHIVESCVTLTRPHADAKGVQLSMQAAPDLPLLTADPTRLKQILLNLLANAVKFTESGGFVTAAVEHGDGGVAFSICDTGRGMTDDEIKIALEPFGQIDSRLARSQEGTGLGLPIAKRLAELHGGSLRIESLKGSGTTVIVTLPATHTAASPLREHDVQTAQSVNDTP